MAAPFPRRGVLLTESWGDLYRQPVVVEAETPKKFRVRAANAELRLPRRGNGILIVLRSGTVLVPKSAVRFED